MNEKAVPALAGIVVLMVAAVAAVILHQRHWTPLTLSIQGAVIRHDILARNELPISGALITATDGARSVTAQSDASGGVRHSYPVIFERTLNFTLPEREEGVSIEAELNGAPMVFPLGPQLYLSWATCIVRTNAEAEKSTVYRCELKPGYRF